MSEITCARCKGHVELGVLSEHKTYHAVCLIQSHAETIESLRAQLAQARSDALEEAASLADDLSDEPSVDQTNPGDIAIHADWSASRSIARSIRSLKETTQEAP